MKIAGIVLAAGKGKRMGSELPKVVLPLCGVPMILYQLNNLKKLKVQTFIVLGHKKEEVERIIPGNEVKIVVQKEQLGTADAVRTVIPFVGGFSHLLILSGDTPMIKLPTIKKLIRAAEDGYDCVFLSGEMENPKGYGRVIRKDGIPAEIKEDRHLVPKERKIKEVNMGAYIIKREALSFAISKVKRNPSSGEYYLTDIIEILYKNGFKITTVSPACWWEGVGVNTPHDLYLLTVIAYREGVRNAVRRGAIILNEDATYISPLSVIKRAIIHPFVRIDGMSKIDNGVEIEEGCIIADTVIKKNSKIKAYSVIEKSIIAENVSAGPFARLREGTILKTGSKIGNFVEVKKSIIGKNVKAQHLSYIGDAEVGEGTNIGAGTITCNFDGFKKNKTYIGKNVFVGSDVQFVAPVRIGDSAWIGAGSTITKDVPPYALGISRAEQKNIKNYAKRKKRCAE
jgi:bifunctional UDP-N-acetylglucosamine pyrophosphorylase/glucosamine-1-phosphate N-acetyltransferase